jgi:hypothetical protein
MKKTHKRFDLICLSTCLDTCLFTCLSTFCFLHLSIHLFSANLYVCQLFFKSVWRLSTMFAYLSFHLSIHLLFWPLVCLTVLCQSAYLSVYQLIHLLFCLLVCPAVLCQSVHMSINLSFNPFVHHACLLTFLLPVNFPVQHSYCLFICCVCLLVLRWTS